jgi:hypothetical protein
MVKKAETRLPDERMADALERIAKAQERQAKASEDIVTLLRACSFVSGYYHGPLTGDARPRMWRMYQEQD